MRNSWREPRAAPRLWSARRGSSTSCVFTLFTIFFVGTDTSHNSKRRAPRGVSTPAVCAVPRCAARRAARHVPAPHRPQARHAPTPGHNPLRGRAARPRRARTRSARARRAPYIQAAGLRTGPHGTGPDGSLGVRAALGRLADAREGLCDLLDEVGLLHELLGLLPQPGAPEGRPRHEWREWWREW